MNTERLTANIAFWGCFALLTLYLGSIDIVASYALMLGYLSTLVQKKALLLADIVYAGRLEKRKGATGNWRDELD